MNHWRHRFVSAAIGMTITAVAVAGCSSTGGKPQSTDGDMAAGAVRPCAVPGAGVGVGAGRVNGGNCDQTVSRMSNARG